MISFLGVILQLTFELVYLDLSEFSMPSKYLATIANCSRRDRVESCDVDEQEEEEGEEIFREG